MKKLLLSIAAAALCATSAIAADMPVKVKAPVAPPDPWDWAFGAALMSDYNFRGISQSNRGPSVTAYSETRYNVNPNLQLYAGEQYWAVTLPTNPTCECDFYAGIRPTVGPLAFDLGFIYYWYPKERQYAAVPGAVAPALPNGNVTLKDTDYWEVYGKVVWTVNETLAFGINEYYSPSWLHTGASGNYLSGTAKVTLPNFTIPFFGNPKELGWYISGEVGRYWLGTTNVVPGVFVPAINLPDYTTWNVGVAWTYKVFTFDVRYYDTDLSKANCNVLTGDPTASFAVGNVTTLNPGGLGSKWCGSAVIAALKFDLSLLNLK